jgi:hypothetical protein
MIRETSVSLEYRTGELRKRRPVAYDVEVELGQRHWLCGDLVACGLCLGHDCLHGASAEECAIDSSCFKVARGQPCPSAAVFRDAVVSCSTLSLIYAWKGGRGSQVRYRACPRNYSSGHIGVRSLVWIGRLLRFPLYLGCLLDVCVSSMVCGRTYGAHVVSQVSGSSFIDGTFAARFTILLFSPSRTSRIPFSQ